MVMASHHDSEVSARMVTSFLDAARKLSAYFSVQQPLQPSQTQAETADDVQKLVNHMHLNHSDACWLLCLTSQLPPRAGTSLVPDLWELKRNMAAAAEGARAQPREPSPFSLPPAALEVAAAQTELQPSWTRKRPRSSSPNYSSKVTATRLQPSSNACNNL